MLLCAMKFSSRILRSRAFAEHVCEIKTLMNAPRSHKSEEAADALCLSLKPRQQRSPTKASKAPR